MKAVLFSPYTFIPLTTPAVSLVWWCSMLLCFDFISGIVWVCSFSSMQLAHFTAYGSFLGEKWKKDVPISWWLLTLSFLCCASFNCVFNEKKGSFTTFVFKTKIQQRLVELLVQILGKGLVSSLSEFCGFLFLFIFLVILVCHKRLLKDFANKPAFFEGNRALLFPFSLSFQPFQKLVKDEANIAPLSSGGAVICVYWTNELVICNHICHLSQDYQLVYVALHP